MKKCILYWLVICNAFFISCSKPVNVDELSELVKSSVITDYMMKIDRPYQQITDVILVQTRKGQYKGKIVSIITGGSSGWVEEDLSVEQEDQDETSEIREDPVFVSLKGKKIIWEAEGFGKFTVAYKTSKTYNVKLDDINLSINGSDFSFYQIKLSNSTMQYLTKEIGISGLGQTVYLHKDYYDETISTWMTTNTIFKEKRTFLEEELEQMQSTLYYFDVYADNFFSPPDDHGIYSSIDINSFPDGQYTSDIVMAKDLQTSLLIIMLMDRTSRMYLTSGISSDYEISGLQESIKNYSKNISKGDRTLFKEIFPDIYKELLIKGFVDNSNYEWRRDE